MTSFQGDGRVHVPSNAQLSAARARVCWVRIGKFCGEKKLSLSALCCFGPSFGFFL